MSEQYVNLESLAIAANAQVMEQPPLRTIISVAEDPIAGYKYYWGEQEIDESAITDAVKRNSEAVLLRATPDITQATIDDILQLIVAGGSQK